MVLHLSKILISYLYQDFNTSNVMVLLRGMYLVESSYSISIHLMLWFFTNEESYNKTHSQISIHLMLWFFYLNKTLYRYHTLISIHLMLWFFPDFFALLTFIALYFNTSNVMVLHLALPPFCFKGYISIHLMLWFFVYLYNVIINYLVFQYI